MMIIIYWILGYVSYGYVNSDKVYFYTFGKLFLHKAVMGLLLGWVYIPWAILKMIFSKK